MSTFEVKLEKIIKVEKHPNADRLSIITINGFNSVSANLENGSPRYKVNDYVVYIPEAALLPDWLLKKMGFWNEEKNIGTLSGTGYNRVKAIKLRQILSQGILYPVETSRNENNELVFLIENETTSLLFSEKESLDLDLASFLSIKKYEPEIPQAMRGEVCNIFGHTFKYDIENIQKFPDVFTVTDNKKYSSMLIGLKAHALQIQTAFADNKQCVCLCNDITKKIDDELNSVVLDVVATEKCHGTFCCMGIDRSLSHHDLIDNCIFSSSKGMFAAGRAFKMTNTSNLYQNMLLSHANKTDTFVDVLKKIEAVYKKPVYILGEIFGRGVQDLHYGFEKPVFRAFDIKIGNTYLNFADFVEVAQQFNLLTVPIIYKGQYNAEKLKELATGSSVFDDKQIREGIVVKPVNEQTNDKIGRVIAKFINPDYLVRNNKNATEFQ